MYEALAFARYGDQDKIAEILETRIRQTEEQVCKIQSFYEEHVPHVPRAALHIMVSALEHCKTELRWLIRLSKDAVEGRLAGTGKPIDFR